uniref:ATP synthase complex subunit 8 n=1 Tax=Argyra pingwuensis TaxID=2762466 RepID=A0A7G6KSC3_9MUSC|nr:ATP synthase F0 subunit 8 [Argyra pingwuensis]QNC71305.1 ATP synthase F0 subunit 8 [Argyra pingwuensis]
MPQMAPINWLILYILFSFTFMLFCVLNFYSFYTSSYKTCNLKKNVSSPLNWKW